MAEVSRSEKVQMIARMPLFAGLTKRQLSTVAKAVDHMSFEPGTALVKELQIGQRLIIILSGTAEVTRRGIVARDGATGGIQQGTSRRLATVGPGDVIGELSLIDGKVASASVVAETPIDALVLYRTSFEELLASTPQLYPRLLAGMAARIRQIDHRTDVVG